jgi:hypothetical protein
MAKPDGRIEKGQRLSTAISARAWNRAQDAADIVLGVRPGVGAGDGIRGPDRPYTWVYCKNNSGGAVQRWGVLAITGMEVAPTGSTGAGNGQFESVPVVAGSTPTSSTSSFGIAVEPIAIGAIGKLAVGGAVQVKLDVQSAAHNWAKPKASTAELQTDHGGGSLVLWKPGPTGPNQWGLVQLCGYAKKVDVLTNVAFGPTGFAFTKESVWVHGHATGVTGVNIGATGC